MLEGSMSANCGSGWLSFCEADVNSFCESDVKDVAEGDGLDGDGCTAGEEEEDERSCGPSDDANDTMVTVVASSLAFGVPRLSDLNFRATERPRARSRSRLLVKGTRVA